MTIRNPRSVLDDRSRTTIVLAKCRDNSVGCWRPKDVGLIIGHFYRAHEEGADDATTFTSHLFHTFCYRNFLPRNFEFTRKIQTTPTEAYAARDDCDVLKIPAELQGEGDYVEAIADTCGDLLPTAPVTTLTGATLESLVRYKDPIFNTIEMPTVQLDLKGRYKCPCCNRSFHISSLE